MCDLAYLLILDELRQVVLVDRQAAISAVVQGADLEIPDWSDERDKFDEALCAPPAQRMDDEKATLRRALGLPERSGRH